MPLHRVAALLLLAIASGLAGCRGGKPAAQPPPPAQVTVVRPAVTDVRDYWEYNGYLDTTESVDVRARVKGFLNKVIFEEGKEVVGEFRWVNGEPLYTGELLYQIDKREYITAQKKARADVEKAKAEVLNWTAQIRLAEAELERATTASKSGVGSKTEFDKAQATVDVNKAEKSAAEANLGSTEAALHTTEIQLGYTDVRAKISGLINRTLVTEGNLVGQTDPTLLTTIVRVDELFVNFDAPEADLVAFQRAMMTGPQVDPTSRKIDVEVAVATEFGYPHRGKIDFRENRVDTATGTVRVRGRIPNPLITPPLASLAAVVGIAPVSVIQPARALYPGLYARVRVPAGDPRSRLVIPEDCLMSGQEGRFVYVVGPDNKVEKRLVKLGPVVPKPSPTAPGEIPATWSLVNPAPTPPKPGVPPAPARRVVKSMVSVIGNLGPDDRVIVDGLQKARPMAEVNPEVWDLRPPPPTK